MRINPRRLMGLAVLATILVIVAAGARHEYRKLRAGGSQPPPPGAPAADAGGDLVRALRGIGVQRGILVWSSNRHGNHDILLLDLADGRIRRLTEHPHTDYHPRISPDGRRVVFARSQRPWVSYRDPVPWDVITVDLASGAERLVARNGNTPTWSADGRTIYFQRNVEEVVAYDVERGAERLLYKSGTGGLPAGVELQTPNLHPDGRRLAVTLRRAQSMTALVQPGAAPQRIGDGCQLAWAPDGDFLYYVDHGGRMENAIFRVDPAGGARVMWLDHPGPYSHEYFPRLSNERNYLVFGASGGGHEHDTADYEIFLWRVGSAPGAAVRITYHTGNDNWPDIHIPPR